MKVPIACTLAAGSAQERIAEWRQALRAAVTSSARPSPTRVELRLVDDPGRMAALIDLARREKACCAFFNFTVEIEAESITMVVTIPDGAVEVLDEFASLV